MIIEWPQVRTSRSAPSPCLERWRFSGCPSPSGHWYRHISLWRFACEQTCHCFGRARSASYCSGHCLPGRSSAEREDDTVLNRASSGTSFEAAVAFEEVSIPMPSRGRGTTRHHSSSRLGVHLSHSFSGLSCSSKRCPGSTGGPASGGTLIPMPPRIIDSRVPRFNVSWLEPPQFWSPPAYQKPIPVRTRVCYA